MDRVADSILPMHSFERDRMNLVSGSIQGMRVHPPASAVAYAQAYDRAYPERYYSRDDAGPHDYYGQHGEHDYYAGPAMPRRPHMKVNMHVHMRTPHPTPDPAIAEKQKALIRDLDAEQALFGDVSSDALEQETSPESQTVGDDDESVPSVKSSRGPIDPMDVRADRYHHKTREPHAKPLMDKAGVEELKERARHEGRIPSLSVEARRQGGSASLAKDSALAEGENGSRASKTDRTLLTARGRDQGDGRSSGLVEVPMASSAVAASSARQGNPISDTLKSLPAMILPSADYPFLCPCVSAEDRQCRLAGFEALNCGVDAPAWEGCSLCIWEMFSGGKKAEDTAKDATG